MVILLLSMGCEMGAADGTLLTDLHVVHAGAEPPEVAPGETVDLQMTVADPVGEGAEVLVWPCTDLGEGCLEDQGQAVSDWVVRTTLEDELASASVPVDPALASLLAVEADFTPSVNLWVLACRSGLCPVFEEVDAQPEVGTDEDAALRAILNDPIDAMGSLPTEGTSLVQRRLPLTVEELAERNANPLLVSVVSEPLTLATGEELLLDFEIWDDSASEEEMVMYGFATVGGVNPARASLSEGLLTWVAGEEPGEGRLYVVLLDGQGGSALWTGEVVVE